MRQVWVSCCGDKSIIICNLRQADRVNKDVTVLRLAPLVAVANCLNNPLVCMFVCLYVRTLLWIREGLDVCQMDQSHCWPIAQSSSLTNRNRSYLLIWSICDVLFDVLLPAESLSWCSACSFCSFHSFYFYSCLRVWLLSDKSTCDGHIHQRCLQRDFSPVPVTYLFFKLDLTCL